VALSCAIIVLTPQSDTDPGSEPAAPLASPLLRGLTRSVIWRWARYLIGITLAVLAIYVVEGKSDELSGASSFLDNLRWWWIIPAALAEAASYVSFAALQQELLAAGDVPVPLVTLTGITLAGNAIQNTLPAGAILSVGYSFRLFRRYGADDVLSGWAIVAMGAVSLITISALAAIGLGLAASTGSALDLVTSIVGVAATAALVIFAWTRREFLLEHSEGLIRLIQRLFHRPKGDARQVMTEVRARIGMVTPSRGEWMWATTYAMGNWLLDLCCLALSFLAIGTGVPWDGLLLAYAAAQLAANLPITPGGLGVVEGSLTVALVAFGGGEVSTVAAVLLYRLMNFWAMLPLGWSAWAWLAVLAKRRPELTPGAPLAPLSSAPLSSAAEVDNTATSDGNAP
jgi:uncharacterized protein (TIRG00374 family)